MGKVRRLKRLQLSLVAPETTFYHILLPPNFLAKTGQSVCDQDRSYANDAAKLAPFTIVSCYFAHKAKLGQSLAQLCISNSLF
jgi:hypothetical protein